VRRRRRRGRDVFERLGVFSNLMLSEWHRLALRGRACAACHLGTSAVMCGVCTSGPSACSALCQFPFAVSPNFDSSPWVATVTPKPSHDEPKPNDLSSCTRPQITGRRRVSAGCGLLVHAGPDDPRSTPQGGQSSRRPVVRSFVDHSRRRPSTARITRTRSCSRPILRCGPLTPTRRKDFFAALC